MNRSRKAEADAFEDLVQYVRRRAAGDVEGIFGPDSITWEVVREVALFLGGPRAVLLQLAHPAIAAAIAQHSDVHRDPLGRGRRTFEAMLDIVFGDLETAIASARRIRRRHVPVHGEIPGSGARYDALDPDLGVWVLATLTDTIFTIFGALVRPLAEEERADLYDAQKLVAALLGVPPETMPRDVAAFDAYMRSAFTGSMLDVGDNARAEFAALLDAPPSAYITAVLSRQEPPLPVRFLDGALGRRVVRSLVEEITAALLPPQVQRGYGLPPSRLEDAPRRAAIRVLGRAYRALPPHARFNAAYHAAYARVAAKPK